MSLGSYEQLIADVVKFSSLGHVIVQGDFNAYANTKQDFVSYDDSGRSNPKDDHGELYIVATYIYISLFNLKYVRSILIQRMSECDFEFLLR
jgi:hypothetical protein